jgi:hypothetical protein
MVQGTGSSTSSTQTGYISTRQLQAAATEGRSTTPLLQDSHYQHGPRSGQVAASKIATDVGVTGAGEEAGEVEARDGRGWNRGVTMQL